MSDLIEIKLAASIGDDSISQIKQQISQIEQSAKGKKLKLFDEDSLKKSGAEVVKVKDTIKKTVKEIEDSYKSMGEVSVKGQMNPMTKDMENFTVKVKEADGVTKQYGYTLVEMENKQRAFVNTSIKSSEDASKGARDLLRDKERLLTIEKQLNTAQKQMGKLNPQSDEYKKLNAEAQRLRDTQREYMGDLKNIDSTKLRQLATDTKAYQTELGKARILQQEVIRPDKLAGDAQRAGRNIMAIGAPLVALGGISVKAANDYESAFAGVRKTVDATEEQFQVLSDSMRNLSKEMPQSAAAIANVGEVAGQLGIAQKDIIEFTRVMIMLGDSTTLSSEQAASELAKFANITKMSADDYQKLGSAIVDLGNNFATTEDEIVAMGLRLAGAGSQIGLSEAEILGISTALSSVGIKAQMGGSAFSRIMTDMSVASTIGVGKVKELEQATGMARRELELMSSNDGKGFKELAQELGYTTKELDKIIKAGRDLEKFSDIAGVSAEEFQKAFAEDAIGAIGMFIDGLADAENRGTSAIEMLEELGVSSVRIRDTLLRTGGASELFADAIKTGNGAWEENTALVEEANKRYETAESKLAMLKNRVVDAGIELGGNLSPALVEVVDSVVKVIEAFAKLPESLQVGIIKAGLFTTAFGGILSMFGRSARGASEIGSFFGDVGKLMGGSARLADDTTKSMGATNGIIKLLTSSTGLYVAGALAVIGIAATEIKKHIDETAKKKEELKQIAKDIPQIVENHESDIEYLKDIQDEFEFLSKLVKENGDLSQLSADQQEKYLDMVKKMSDMFPEMETFYNNQGQLVAGTREEIDKLIQSKEKEMALDKQKAADGYEQQLEDHRKFIEKREKQKEKAKKNMEQSEELLTKIDPVKSPESAKKHKDDIEKYKKELQELERIPMEKINETVEIMAAKISYLSGEMENANPHLTEFEEGLKQILENDPSTEGLDKADKAADHILEIGERLERAYNNEIKIHPGEIGKYTRELTDYGMEWETVSGILFGAMTEIEGSEEKLNLVNKAVSEWNSSGKITEETSEVLQNTFGNVTKEVENLDLGLLKSIAATDKWAAAYIASQIKMETGITDLKTTYEKQLSELPTWEIVTEEDINKQLEISGKASKEMLDTIESDAESQKEIVRWMHEELGVISEEQMNEQLNEINTNLGLRRVEHSRYNDEYAEILRERGQITRDGIREAAFELEEGTRDIDDIWRSMDDETREYFIKTYGIEETEEGMKELEKLFEKDPLMRQFLVEAKGFDFVRRHMDELGEAWEEVPSDQKDLVARMIGYGLEDIDKFNTEWENLSDETKEYFIDLITEGIDEIPILKKIWDEIETEEKELKVKNSVEGQSDIEYAELVWQEIENETKDHDIEGEVNGGELIKDFEGFWTRIPKSENKTKTMTFEQITNRREFLHAPQKVHTSSTGTRYENRWTGDDNFKGGLSYVGEKGRELLVYPDGTGDMTGDTTELRNLPKGTRIFNNPDTEKILTGEKIPKFAKGNVKAGTPKPSPKPNIGNTSEEARRKAKAAADEKVKAKKKEKEQEKEILDILDAQIRRVQIKNDHLIKTRDLLEKQLSLASKDNTVKGINEQLKITGNLIRNNEAIIKSFQSEQTKVHEMANNVRKQYSKYKIDTWFDANGEQTPEFVVQFNAAGTKKMQDEMKEVYGKVEKLKKAWMDADTELKSHIETNEELKRSLDDINEKMQAIVSERLSDSKSWIEKRNFYEDWGEDSEIDALDRMRDYIENYYVEGILSYKQYANYMLDIDKDRFNAQQKIYDEEKKLRDEKHAEEIKQYEERRDKWIKERNDELQAQRDRLSALDSIQEAVVRIIRKRGEEEKKALEKSHKSEIDSLEERHKKRKELYKEELDEYQKMIEGKLSAMDEQYKEEDYIEDLNKEREKASEIQRQIDVLVLDDSLTARNKTTALRKELAEQNERIAKMQQQKERELLKKSLEDQLKNKQEDVNKREEIADEVYNNEKKRIEEDYEISKTYLDRKYEDDMVYAEAKESIIRGTVEVSKGSFEDIYEAYKSFENRFGQGMGILGNIIKTDFLDQLEQARQAIRDLEYEQRARENYTDRDYDRIETRPEREPDRYEPPSRPSRPTPPPQREPNYGVGATGSHAESNRVEDKLNSDSAYRRSEIARTEQVIRDRLSAGMDVSLQEKYLRRLISGSYANGGKITDTGMVLNDFHGSKSNPEWIFNDSQLKKIMKDIATASASNMMIKAPNILGGGQDAYDIDINVEGSMDKSLIPKMKALVTEGIDEAQRRKISKYKDAGIKKSPSFR